MLGTGIIPHTRVKHFSMQTKMLFKNLHRKISIPLPGTSHFADHFTGTACRLSTRCTRKDIRAHSFKEELTLLRKYFDFITKFSQRIVYLAHTGTNLFIYFIACSMFESTRNQKNGWESHGHPQFSSRITEEETIMSLADELYYIE